jgi:hypothetical protein
MRVSTDSPAVAAAPGRWAVRAAGLAAVLLFLGFVARFWHPVYGFTAFLQLDASNDDTKIAAFRELPVYVYRGTGGYDGLYYAQIAYHPSLTAAELQRATDGLSYRARRILMPLLAWMLALGNPAWIVHVYSLLNVAAWLVLAAWLWQLLAVSDARGWLAWAGLLFSAGALCSVRYAVPDLVALTFLAGAMLACERGRTGLALGAMAAAGLARETSLAALTAPWKRPWFSWRNAVATLLIVMPLAAWIGYVRWRIGPGGIGARNLAWPFTGWIEKWLATFAAMRTEGDLKPVWTTLLATLALTVQAAFFLKRPRLEDRWWRVGAGFVALLLCLGTAVWEGFPGAATRVLLPLNLAFNVLVHRTRAPLAWLLAGNLTVAAGLLALNDPPSDPNELAAIRAQGTACVATLRDGWYGRERASGHTWAWSRGRAAIALEAWPKDAVVPRLEFALRSLAPRTVILSQAGRELWRGSVGVPLTPRQSVPVQMAGGHASIEFTTDSRGVPESGNADARLLAFALYDARLVVQKP